MAKNNNLTNISNFRFDEAYNKEKWALHFGESFQEEYGAISNEDEILEKHSDFLEKVIWIGDLNTDNGETIGVYEVYIKNTNLASRVKISRLCSKIITGGERNTYGKGIFFILYNDKKNNYRVSYVKHDKVAVLLNKDVRFKRDYSNPKRYTFLLGEGIKVHTPESRLKSDIFNSVESIENAFSVEPVNKEFYNGVKEYFDNIYKDVIKYFNKDENRAKEFALRFLGRILFCWFLREKELIPSEILNSKVFENLKYKKNYYSDVLEDLFFNVLNIDMEKRSFSKDRVISNYEKEIPFLNGGLFSKKEDDEAVKIIDDDIVKGLFEFFEMYNFTVDESAPFDVEISIDPEMLGRIFENLLAEINPETKESARKETGSFYTPREIVDYMVMEAIKLYLYKKLPDIKDKIDRIFDIEDSIEYSDKERESILKNIHDMIILDPACGSGAFPLGILQRVFNVIDKLDPKHEYYKDYIINKLPSGTKEEFKKLYDAKKFSYAYKLDILQSMIHGVDIQPIAVEVSKLRAFLSLVVDEKREEKESNFGIKTLPNLEFQFICANTLVPLEVNSTEELFIKGHIENLKKSIKNYFNIHDKEDKKVAENDIEAFFEQIERDENLERATKTLICSWHPFKNKAALYFDSELQFGLERNFDIVIGNPPYIQLQTMAKDLKEMYQNAGYESFKSTGDIYQLFYEKSLKLLSDEGVSSLITSNKWMRAGYGVSTREYFYKNADVLRIIDLGAGRFESATVDVNIIFYSKTKKKNIKGERSFDGVTYSGSLKDISNSNKFDAVVSEAGKEWVIMSGLERSIFNKINKHKALKDWDIKINFGIKTGFNDAFFIDEETKNNLIKEDAKSAELIKPLIRGRNIIKYYSNVKEYLINTHNGIKEKNIPPINIKDYPAIKKHLDKYYKQLENRGDKGNTPYNLRNCAYLEDFGEAKIAWGNISSESRFCYLFKDFFVSAPANILVVNSKDENILKYLLAVMNSKVFNYQFTNFGITLGQAYEWKKQYVEPLKIPEADTNTKKNILKLVDSIINLKKQNKDTYSIEKDIDNIVYSLYGLTDEEIKVIEGA